MNNLATDAEFDDSAFSIEEVIEVKKASTVYAEDGPVMAVSAKATPKKVIVSSPDSSLESEGIAITENDNFKFVEKKEALKQWKVIVKKSAL